MSSIDSVKLCGKIMIKASGKVRRSRAPLYNVRTLQHTEYIVYGNKQALEVWPFSVFQGL